MIFNLSSDENIESWDSVSQINLILALETEFEVDFEAEKAMNMTSYKLIIESLKELGIEFEN